MPRTAISATTMDSLPVDEALPRLKEALAGRNAAVLVAPPGAGKTTRVPLALVDVGLAQRRDAVLQHGARIGIDDAGFVAPGDVLRRGHLVEAGIGEQLGPLLELLAVDGARVGGIQLDQSRHIHATVS